MSHKLRILAIFAIGVLVGLALPLFFGEDATIRPGDIVAIEMFDSPTDPGQIWTGIVSVNYAPTADCVTAYCYKKPQRQIDFGGPEECFYKPLSPVSRIRWHCRRLWYKWTKVFKLPS